MTTVTVKAKHWMRHVLIIVERTSIGVLSADNFVNPQMSLKYIVTHSNDSGSTTLAFFNCSAMDLKISETLYIGFTSSMYIQGLSASIEIFYLHHVVM